MQPGIPDLHSVGVRVGDILPAIFPAHLIPKCIHVLDKFCFAATPLHTPVHRTHQLKLPTLAFDCRPIFASVHTITFLLTLRQHGQPMLHTEVIGYGSQVLQRVWSLPQHSTGLMADRVDQKVRVNVRRINMSGDQHLTVRPSFCRKLFCDLMGLASSHILLRMERLRVVIKPDRTGLVEHITSGNELPRCKLRVALPAANQLQSSWLHGLFLLHHIVRDLTECGTALTAVSNEIHRRHATAVPVQLIH